MPREGARKQAKKKQLTLTEIAYRELEERIVKLELAPGAVLSEALLAKQLNIGRTPIREALQQLAREGLVIVLPRRGVIVSKIDVKRQLELVRFRRELERMMAKLAAQRATSSEQKKFADIAKDLRQAGRKNNDVTFMQLDKELTMLMSKSCRNEFAQRAMSLTHDLSRRFWFIHYKDVLDLPLCAKLHANLSDAIARGTTRAAAKASDALMDYIEDFTRASLDAPRRGVADFA